MDLEASLLGAGTGAPTNRDSTGSVTRGSTGSISDADKMHIATFDFQVCRIFTI